MTSSLRPAFHSDNVAGASPQVLAAITEAAAGSAVPYGGDELSNRVADRLADMFDCELSVAPVATGTAANCLALTGC
ncbi:beta-eliminating lyase-related protein [Pokkaliibacter sp. MBI-7]|uniref:beta-eliminating lyase-related protein n=1 Tax=Pokkaliibacter sp. MBI-7 TaxID=3040600 RepID=UPI00244855CF|nr:beta-eliminating lyase-related protein [Pokkaliibacter sp. MBI-7]MDH2433226.1 beta-eliminating lyase-related protein [Pokkaliibacter sp. MBI-7]